MHPSSVLTSRNLSRLGEAKLSQEGPQKLCLPPSRDLPVPGRACAPNVEHAGKGRLSRTPFPPHCTAPPPRPPAPAEGGAEAEDVSPPHTVRSHFRARGLGCAVCAGRSYVLRASPVAENSVGRSHGAVTVPRLSTAGQPLVLWRPTVSRPASWPWLLPARPWGPHFSHVRGTDGKVRGELSLLHRQIRVLVRRSHGACSGSSLADFSSGCEL